MSNLLKIGADWLAQKRKNYAAGEVLYTRGASSVTVSATRGRSTFNIEDVSGLQMQIVTDDFIVTVADLEMNALPIEPAVGDRITETDSLVVFEVMHVPGEPCWRYTDQFRNDYRIHTKRIE